MTITIPEEMQGAVKAKARLRGFASVEDYLLDLIEEDDARPRPSAATGYTPEELEALLDEGAKGPFVLADDAFWVERRRILEQKIAAKAARSS